MSLYLNFRGTFTNSGGHTKFLPVLLKSFPEITVHFYLNLNANSFSSRRGVDDSEVVSAIVLVLNSPANLLFLYLNSFSGLRVFRLSLFLSWMYIPPMYRRITFRHRSISVNKSI